MAFIRTDFGPVGGQGRAGAVPQVFAYTSPTDFFGDVVMPGYFPINPPDPMQNMFGVFRPRDWILFTGDTVEDIEFSIMFILNDGSDGNLITVQPAMINAF
ncbi:MAG: hypothetical protein KAV87_13000 [Desulfobacteraceae bacterium]|nr:hypothetical protein [Desulfobacteraceae bacterium]